MNAETKKTEQKQEPLQSGGKNGVVDEDGPIEATVSHRHGSVSFQCHERNIWEPVCD